MEPKYPKVDLQEKDRETLKFLFDNDLIKYPVIGRLMDTALATGDFREIDRYLSINQGRVQAISRKSLLDEYRQQKNPFYPFPSSADDLGSLSGPIKYGLINPQQNIWLGLNTSDMTMHQMTEGRTGTGKSWA